VAEGDVIDDPHYTTPLYHKAEAAHIIAVPAQTFRNWAVGYARKDSTAHRSFLRLL
jgi:hypothetical protein